MNPPAETAAPPPFPETLVARYEELAAAHPGRYRLELVALASLGHLYVGGLALVLGVLGVLMLALPIPIGLLGLFVGGAALRLLWSFWVRRPPAVGVTLEPEAAHALLDLAGRACAALRCEPPQRIVIGVDCNAAVDASAWRRSARTLQIGLALLLALPARELESVIAHELGHVSRAHGAFSAWIYYVRSTWEKLAQTLGQGGGPVSWLLNRFAAWYWPRFNACSLVQARASERQADRDAVALAGPSVFASGLVRTVVTDLRFDERFGPDLMLRAADDADPPADFCERLAAEITAPDPHHERRLAQALAFRTMYWDTHPSLADRLAAAGVSIERLSPVPTSAAEELLGAHLPDVLKAVNEFWREAMAPAWRERHESLKAGRARMAAIESDAEGAEIDVDEAWERAAWTEEIEGADAALPLYRALLERAPRHHSSQLALGRLLLLRQDPAGVPFVEAALADPWLVVPASTLLYNHYASQGLHAEAERFHRLAYTHGELMEKAAGERSVFTRWDKVEPHGLAPAALERLRKQIGRRTDVLEAYVVRKRVSTFPEKPCFVLGIRERLPWYKPSSPVQAQNLVAELAEAVHFAEPLLFVNLDQERALLNKVRRVEGSRILPG